MTESDAIDQAHNDAIAGMYRAALDGLIVAYGEGDDPVVTQKLDQAVVIELERFRRGLTFARRIRVELRRIVEEK